MKKNVLLVFALLGALSTYAQMTFGVKAGFSYANVSMENNAGKTGLPAFHAGVIGDISLAENFALQPQLLYSAKGFKGKASPTGDAFTYKLNYLELPINFLYKHEMGAGKFFGGFGPYVAMGLSGKAEDVKIKFDGKKEADLTETDEDWHLKALDAGGNIIAGYELKNGLLFSVNYSLSFTNQDPDGAKTKNNYIGISVGYLFGKK